MGRLLLESQTNAISPAQQYVLIGLAALTIVYLVFVRPMRNKGKDGGNAQGGGGRFAKSRDPLARPAGQANLAQQRAIERDMSHLLVEYEAMIRRMTAQVDTRAARLELLIKDAEAVIARLEALGATSKAARPALLPPPTGDAPPDGGPRDEGEPRPRGGEVVDGAGDGAPPAPAPRAEVPAVDAHAADRRHVEIYDLADRGRTPRQIAQALDRPHGEVELILALRERGD